VSCSPAIDPRWHRRALLLAWLTVAYNLIEGGVSIAFGVAEDSVALWGFGFDSLVEVASALVVLWRLRDLRGRATERERRATLLIGGLFLVLGAAIAWSSGWQLFHHEHPGTTLPGLVISALSLSFMVFLWRAKLGVAKALDSSALASDAACSLACIQLSTVLFVGSLIYWAAPALWWVDATAGLALTLLIVREGIEGIRAARRPDFSGGCGCH
jgi:divalent metal cation (Fe/Co/Zn/Cd) transporter